jgi:hypothetical protein
MWAPTRGFEFLRPQRFAHRSVRGDRVGHDEEENFLGQLQDVVLAERGTGHNGGVQSLAPVLEFAPVAFLRDERDVVD